MGVGSVVRFMATLAGLLTASGAVAESLGGIEVGQPEQSALEALGHLGAVSRFPSGFNGYVAGDYSISICDGRVFAVTRNASKSVAAFNRLVFLAATKYGDARDTTVAEQEGGQYLGMVTLKWHLANGLTYSVSEGLWGEQITVSEAFARTEPCR